MLGLGSSNVTSKVSSIFSNASNMGTAPGWQYSYDGASRLTKAIGKNASGTPTQWDYAYDGAGNRTQIKETNTSTSTVVSNLTTTYDASGLPTSASNAVGGESITYTHDAIGDLSVANSSTNANDWGYAYDVYARMSCAKPAATTCTSGTRVQPAYDALDRTVSSVYSSTTTNTYRGLSDVLTRQVGAADTAYANTASGTPLAEKASTVTNASFYLRDPHGDVVGEVTTAAANQGTTAYDPFGKPLATSGTQSVLGFQSDLTDPTTKLVDMGTRYYQPTTGRFTSRDVVSGDPSSPMSLNRFAYAQMSPISNVDPTGMSCDRYTGRCGTGYTRANGQYKHYDPYTGKTTTSGSGGTYESGNWGDYVQPVPVPAPATPSLLARAGNFAVHATADAFRYTTPEGWIAHSASQVTNRSVGMCLGGSVYGGYAIQANACFWSHPDGTFGLTTEGGWGLATSIGANGSLTVAVSNATSQEGLAGDFTTVGLSGGEGLLNFGGSHAWETEGGSTTWVSNAGWTPGGEAPVPGNLIGTRSRTWSSDGYR